MGQQWTAAEAGALSAVDLSMALQHRAARTHTALGKQTLGGHKQNLVCTRTQEKGAVTPQETDPDLPGSVQESLAKTGIGGGQPQG